jgi:hypothetical protein
MPDPHAVRVAAPLPPLPAVSVYVGDADSETRPFATKLHGRLDDPDLFPPDCLSVPAPVATVACTKTRYPLANDSATLSARDLNTCPECRVGGTSTHSPSPLRQRWLTSTVISVS